jgi:prepilin-type N-terminal cleavage/methylation domain-containing protein
MRARQNKHSVRAAGPARRGFTLVELMLVMFILSVLVALVVGVSWYVIQQARKAETISNQTRLMAAVEAYRKTTGKLPYDKQPYDADYNPNGPRDYHMEPEKHMKRLLLVLTGQIPKNPAAEKATKAWLGDTSTNDAYGKSMVYFSDKGVGGKPVVISAGPDGVFGYEKNLADPQRYKEDNIRSDTSN